MLTRRLAEIPKYSSYETVVTAKVYNRMRLALRRLPGQIRVQLRGLRNIDMVVEDEAWVCVDRSMNDLPILAWTGFKTAGRTALYEPVDCLLDYYNGYAGLIARDALKLVGEALDERLKYAKPSLK